MELTVEHVTTYRYSRAVAESYTVVHLQPRTTAYQFCTRYELEVEPAARWFEYVDRFGNEVQHFAIVPEHDELRIVARSHVVTMPRGEPHDGERRTGELFEFLQPSPYVALDDEARRVAATEVHAPSGDLTEYFFAAGRLVHDSFSYRKGATTVRTTVGEALQTRTGVCQDYAHVLIALARARGIPARYASGYIYGGDDGVVGAEASHAWAEAYVPRQGWVGYDPTNDRVVDESFVLVALGRDYGDVSPTRGLFRGLAEGELSVNVAVETAGEQQ